MNLGCQCKDHNRQAVWLAIILTESAFNKYSGHCETSRKLVDSSNLHPSALVWCHTRTGNSVLVLL